MDNNEINNIFLKLQDLYFKKSSEEDIDQFLTSKHISIDWLVQRFETLEIKDEYRLENILKIIEILITYHSYRSNLYVSIINKQDVIINSKIPQIPRFILNFLMNNSEFFLKENVFVNKLLTVFLFDENAGIYEQARNVMLFILNCGKFDEKFIDTDSIFQKFGQNKNDSISLVRGVEIVTMIMSSNEQFINNYTKNLLSTLLKDFYSLDILTQLTLLDLFDQSINNKSIARFILDDLNLFENLQKNEIYPEIYRKSLFCITKYYGRNLVYDKSEMTKTLKSSLGYFDDTSDYNFICSIWQNLFHNEGFYFLLLGELKETFLERVTRNIVESYNYYDPNVKSHILELFVTMFDFKVPSISHDNYVKYFLQMFYKNVMNKDTNNENEVNEVFISTLYKDFKTFDYEEYEYIFLLAIKSILSYDPLYKKAVNYLDLDLYLLNRRVKKNEICELKYEVINLIVKNGNSGEIEKNLITQFNKYLNKGIY